jgi:acetyl-CoA acyltransferase
VEHMGHHPMGEGVDPNPRILAERLVDPSALVMGQTAENLHDRFPQITKADADAFAVQSQQRAAAAWTNGVMRETVVPMSVFTEEGWKVADNDEFLRPDTTLASWPRRKRLPSSGSNRRCGSSPSRSWGSSRS